MIGLAVIAMAISLIDFFFAAWIYLGWRKLSGERHLFGSTHLPPLSVVVCAKNEELHLQSLLEKLSAQVYPVFEVIVVDDGSTDQTFIMANDFAHNHGHVRVIKHQGAGVSGKKGALKAGISAARFECCVFTDADCSPADDHWLQRFGSAYAKGADVVIGTGLYLPGNDFLGVCYAAIAHQSMCLYHASAAWNLPFMCVGRSMGYKKSAYAASGGFEALPNVPSGSDDLLLQAIPLSFKKVSVPDALTYSHPPASWEAWVDQRARHLGTAAYYPLRWKILLPLRELCILLLPLILVFFAVHTSFMFWVLIVTWMAARIFYGFTDQLVGSLLGVRRNGLHISAMTYIAFWLNALISITSRWHTKKEWKVDR